MTEVNSVGDAEGLGFGIDDAMAAVMLERDADVESVRAAEVSGAASGWLIVGDDGAAKWKERGGIVVCVCVCFWPPVTRWGTVMHEKPISSPPPDDIPSIP